MAVTFSNPRLHAEFADWPSGRDRVRCVFQVEQDKRGWRVSCTTTGKPKFSTYFGPAAIVDGSDGRTYILQVAKGYGFIRIMRHDFMDATGHIGRQGCVFPNREDADLHKELLALILQAAGPVQAMTNQ